MIELDPEASALILIDLQKGIVGMPVEPRSGAETFATCKALAEKFRAAGAKVVLVRVDFAADFADALNQPADAADAGRAVQAGASSSRGSPRPATSISSSIIGAPSTAPSSICSCAAVASPRSSSAASPPISASNPPRARPGSAATRSSSPKTRARACRRNSTTMAIKSIFPRISRVTTSAEIGFAAK